MGFYFNTTSTVDIILSHLKESEDRIRAARCLEFSIALAKHPQDSKTNEPGDKELPSIHSQQALGTLKIGEQLANETGGSKVKVEMKDIEEQGGSTKVKKWSISNNGTDILVCFGSSGDQEESSKQEMVDSEEK